MAKRACKYGRRKDGKCRKAPRRRSGLGATYGTKRDMYAVYMITSDAEFEAVTRPMTRDQAVRLAKSMTRKNKQPYVVHGAWKHKR